MKFKRYESVFKKESVQKQSNKKSLKFEKSVSVFKRALREEGLAPSDVDSVIDKVEDLITDVIDEHGLDNEVVDSLSSAVKDLNMQNEIIDEIGMYESKYSNLMTEMEDEDDAEEMEESEDEDSEDKSEDSKKVEESKRIKRIKEMNSKLKNRMKEEEEDDSEEMEEEFDMDDEDDMEESINGFKTKTKTILEDEDQDEGDLIDDMSGSDYDELGIDDMGEASSDRDMDADYDDNSSDDGA